MSGRLRWAVYRDRRPLSPVYLGDVLAGADKEAATREGAKLYGAPVVVHRGGDKPGRQVSPELERAVTNREKRVGRGKPRDWRVARGKNFRDGGAR